MHISSLTSTLLIIAFMMMTAPVHGMASTDQYAARTGGLWQEYKNNFIQGDGRVIDKQQKDTSHSESQGYGMLNAVFQGDRKTFDDIWRWTRDNLQARRDNLLPWSWGKRRNGQWGIIDYNNATDGDLLIAYALIEAANNWQNDDYRREGQGIVRGIREKLAVSRHGQTFLLPAYYGFIQDDGLVLNPSYAIFAAYRAFAEVDDRDFWNTVYDDGLSLVERCRFGTMQLPSDWVLVNGQGIEIWDKKPEMFGYEAVRIFLYLAWEKKVSTAGLDKLFSFYEKNGYLPDSIDLSSNQITHQEAPAGFYAVYAHAAESLGRTELGRRLWKKAFQMVEHQKSNYYSMSLLLLALNNGRS